MGPLELMAFAQRNKALTGEGLPSASLAVPGKLYINTLTGDLYKCAVAGTWIMQTGGGGGEPDEYIKSASVSGNTLTLTDQDDSTVSFTPEETVIDDTLSQTGQAADAKAAGDQIKAAFGTVTKTTNNNVTLVNGNTTVINGARASISATLPAPVSGQEYCTGIIIKYYTNLSYMNYGETAPEGYTVHWDSIPVWTKGSTYEIIYRCIWIDNVISATWHEVAPQ